MPQKQSDSDRQLYIPRLEDKPYMGARHHRVSNSRQL